MQNWLFSSVVNSDMHLLKLSGNLKLLFTFRKFQAVPSVPKHQLTAEYDSFFPSSWHILGYKVMSKSLLALVQNGPTFWGAGITCPAFTPPISPHYWDHSYSHECTSRGYDKAWRADHDQHSKAPPISLFSSTETSQAFKYPTIFVCPKACVTLWLLILPLRFQRGSYSRPYERWLSNSRKQVP